MDDHTASRLVYSRVLREAEILSLEEERRLMAVYHSDKNTLKQRMQARKKILLSHQPLVCSIARYYAKRTNGANLDDFLGEGNLGLLDAIEKYDPKRRTRFMTYAQWWIRAYVAHYAKSQHRTVRRDTSRVNRKILAGYSKARHQIEQEIATTFRESPSHHQDEIEERIAEHFKTSVEKIREYHASLSPDTPIDTIGGLVHANGGIEIGVLDDRSDMLDQQKLISILREKYELLSPIEKDVLTHRFGVGKDPRGFETTTLREIGKKYDLCGERIRQIEKKVIENLRMSLEAVIGHEEA